MKTFVLFALVLLNMFHHQLTHAQAPNWLWANGAGGTGGEVGNGIASDPGGNVITTGNFYSSSITFGSVTLSLGGTQDVFVVKYDGSGNALWAKRAGGTGSCEGHGIATDAGGNIFITGMYGGSITFDTITLLNSGGGSYDMFVAKYDPNGNVLWAKKAGGLAWDQGTGIAADDSGNVLVTGHYGSSSITFGTTTLTNSGFVDIFIVKYDGSGNVLWAKKAGGNHNDYGIGISTDANGNALVTGTFNSSTIIIGADTLADTGTPNGFTAKYDPAGNALWARTSVNGGCYSRGIVADVAGNAIVSGFFQASTSFGSDTLTSAGQEDMFLVKYDAGGNVLWAKLAGGTAAEDCPGITTDGSGNILATGTFASASITFGSTTLTNAGSGSADIFVVKYDGNGNALWATSAGGTGVNNSFAISMDATGNTFVTGSYWNAPITFGTTTLSNAGSIDFFVAKMDFVVGLEAFNFSKPIRIFPNPFSAEFTFSVSNYGQTTVLLYNLLGQPILHQTFTNATTLNTEQLAKGIYFYELRNDKGTLKTGKVAKQ